VHSLFCVATGVQPLLCCDRCTASSVLRQVHSLFCVATGAQPLLCCDRCTASSVLRQVHSFFCVATGPQPLPKRVLRTVRSSASSFNFEYPFASLRSSSSCLRLLPHLAVLHIPRSIFPSIMCIRRPMLRKMWPIQLAFLLFLVCRIFLSCLTPCSISFLIRSVQLIFSIFRQHLTSKLPSHSWSTFQSVHVLAPYKTLLVMRSTLFSR
jgi:hypothetical protein